jgi:plasmid stability protein
LALAAWIALLVTSGPSHRVRIKVRIFVCLAVRTTLELPDPLFARLKARAALEGTTLKQLLRSFVEQGLADPGHGRDTPARRAADLPRIDAELPLRPDQLSNAGLFALLEEE